MHNRTFIIAGVVALIVIVAVLFFSKGDSEQEVSEQMVSTSDPMNTVLDFYDPWLSAVKASDTDPYQRGLNEEPLLSPELRTKLADMKDREIGEPDPVLCQTEAPTGISARRIYQNADEAQVLVMSTEPGQTAQAVVTLPRLNDGWYIKDITCSLGEFAPDREFTFEREGFLLKSVEPPLDPQYWHLVFEEDGRMGHTAPLFFGAESTCMALDGSQSTCDPNSFTEPSKAFVQGEMTEAGVEVKRVELRE